MVVEQTQALISYDKNTPQDRDAVVATQLAEFLERKKIKADVKGYHDSYLDPDSYQWLILVYSSGNANARQMDEVVCTACDLVVQRRMRGVLAVTTTPSDLPSEWASIRRYDASDPTEDVAGSVLRAMQYAKVPYTKAQEPGHSRHQGVRAFSQKKILLLMLLIIVIVLAVTPYGVITITNNLNAPSYLTATAQSQAHARATQTAGAMVPTASSTVDPTTQQAKQNDFTARTKSTPTIQGFQDADQWSSGPVTDVAACASGASNTYLAVIKTSGQYTPCLAKKTQLTNFVLQVTMSIKGDAGGVIFRSNEANGTYYRLAVNQSDQTTPTTDTLSLVLCNSNCVSGNVNNGTSLLPNNTPATITVDRTKPITLAMIAQGNIFDVFINKQFVMSITDPTFPTPITGHIGVYAAKIGAVSNTTVTFKDLKVWPITDTQPTKQPTSP